MKQLAFFTAIVLFLSIIGCSSPAFEQELKTIDELLLSLDSAQLDIDKLTPDALEEAEKKAGTQLRFIQKNWRDSMDRDLASKLSQYYLTKEGMEKWMEEYRMAGEELEFTTEQLVALRNDVANEMLAADSVSAYLDMEQEAAKNVLVSVANMQLAQDRLLQQHRSLEPKVDSLVQVMNQNGIR